MTTPDVDPVTMRVIRRLAEQVADHERRIRSQARASQAQFRAVEGGAQNLYDEDDELRAVVGEQPDGTYTVTTYGGPAPVAPSAPLVSQLPGGATITWDGYDANDELGWPDNMAGVRVHLSTVPGEPADQDTHVATIYGAQGGAFTVSQPADVTTYCTLVAFTEAYVVSVQSGEVTVVGGAADASLARTTSTDPPPDLEDATGYTEGHQWWQIVDGTLQGVWEATGGAWMPLELVSGQVAYFQQALIEALQVTGLDAVTLTGGSLFIAQGEAGSVEETFTGTSLPAGWTSTAVGPDGTGTAGAAVPGASVVATGPPGQDGSAILIDLGPANLIDATGAASGEITTDLGDAANAEMSARFRMTINRQLFQPDTVDLAIRSQGGAAFSATWDAVTLGLMGLEDVFGNKRDFQVRVWLNGTATDLGVVSIPERSRNPTNYWCRAKLRVSGGQVSAKVWIDGTTEPAWTTFEDGAFSTPGRVSLVWRQYPTIFESRGQDVWVDELNVTTYATGFRVNPDGTGEWPAIGISAGDLTWHTVGAGGEPAFEHGYTAFTAGDVQFKRSPTGAVAIVGRAAPGTANDAVFTLPEGYRPSRDLTDIITKKQGTGEFTTMEVLANGQVIVRAPGTSTWVSLTTTFSAT